MPASYPEDEMRLPIPDVVEVCGRCRRHLMVFLGWGDGHPSIYDAAYRPEGWCYGCGNRGRGVRFVRAPDASQLPVQDTVPEVWLPERLHGPLADAAQTLAESVPMTQEQLKMALQAVWDQGSSASPR